MSVYLKKFETHNEYETYIASEDKVLPNVSFCQEESEVHYNPYVGIPKVELKYYVSNDDLGNDIRIFHDSYYAVPFETMEVDGVLLDSVLDSYRFETEGIHTVKLTLPEGGTELKGFYGCYNLIEAKIPSIITSIGYDAFSNCSRLTSVSIPNSVVSIGWGAFIGCSSLTSIAIPNSVASIGESAFSNCSRLTSVSIPNSVVSIGSDAFGGCSGLASIKVQEGNSVYDSRNNCNAIIETATNTLVTGCKNTTIPNNVTSIASSAFYGCSGLTSVTIPNSVTSIGGSAFRDCSSLTSITIPNSVTNIGGAAFEGTAWYNNQSNGLVYVGKVAYKYKGTMPPYTPITIKDDTLGIAGGAFYGCSGLTSIAIPNSVASIGSYAFYDCSRLTSVSIPNSVTSIEGAAFRDCSRLTSVTINATTPPILGERSFDETNDYPIYVPSESVETYKAATNWSEYTDRIQAIP